MRRRPTGYCRVEQGTSIKRTRADRASRTRRNTAPSSETSGVQSKKPTIRAAVFVDFFASRFLRVFSCFGAFVKGSNDAKNNSSHLSLSRPLIFAPTAATAADPGIRRRRCALADVRHPARRREGRGGGGGWGDGAGRAAAGRRIRPALGAPGGGFRPRANGVSSVLRAELLRAVRTRRVSAARRPRGGAEQRRVSEHDSREDIARKATVRSGDVMTLRYGRASRRLKRPPVASFASRRSLHGSSRLASSASRFPR